MSKWKFMQIEPQPARGTLREEMWTSPDWIAEEKYDGDRRIAQFCGRVVRFTGRRKSVQDGLYVEKTSNVPHLSGYRIQLAGLGAAPWHPPPAVLEGTVLDGEMMFATFASTCADRGGQSKYVTSIMGSLPEEAVRKQIERGWLRYVVFDCLWARGQDIRHVTYNERRAVAEAIVKDWGNPFVSISLLSGLVERQKRGFLDAVLKRGGEGVILKRLDHHYGDKQGWVKVKAEWTADVVITGFKDAKEMSKKVNGDVSMTKYAKAGLIGAIVCGQHIEDPSDATVSKLLGVATVSGMDDALRAEFTKHPKKHIGRVIEIAHNGREPTGRFRHPRFKRFRDDKAARECIYREGEV